MHYRSGEKNIYFISNYSKKRTFSSVITFDTDDVQDNVPWLWNAENGERHRYPYEHQKNKIQLELGPAESKLIIFDQTSSGKKWTKPNINPKKFDIVKGPWKLALDHVDKTHTSLTMNTLKDFKKIPSLHSFAGIIQYRNTFSANPAKSYMFLDLGEVHGISEVIINGTSLGIRWYGERLYEVGDVLKNDKNEIIIKITTVLGNYVKSLTKNKVAQNWTRNQELQSAGLIGPVKLFL